MKITKYGFEIIITFVIAFAIALVLQIYFQSPIFKICLYLFGFITLFNLYFFRDPQRTIIKDENAILSPADGKVVLIDEIEESKYINGPAKRVSVFLSVFNVHVNRQPTSGAIEFFEYKKGDFLAAFNHKASENNEQTIIGIKSKNGKVMFKQIAGLIARRIVCPVKVGDIVEQGDRVGMIKYGSRVDIILPTNFTIKVKDGDIVKGGLSVIGEFNG